MVTQLFGNTAIITQHCSSHVDTDQRENLDTFVAENGRRSEVWGGGSNAARYFLPST